MTRFGTVADHAAVMLGRSGAAKRVFAKWVANEPCPRHARQMGSPFLARRGGGKGGGDLKTEGLDGMLTSARQRDALTLWHLLARTSRPDRVPGTRSISVVRHAYTGSVMPSSTTTGGDAVEWAGAEARLERNHRTSGTDRC